MSKTRYSVTDYIPLSPDDVKYLRLVIKETFSGKRTYINNIFFIWDNALGWGNQQFKQSERLVLQLIFTRKQRARSSQENNIKSKEEKYGMINSNNNVISTMENQLLISDSELSEKRFDHYVVPPQLQKVEDLLLLISKYDCYGMFWRTIEE